MEEIKSELLLNNKKTSKNIIAKILIILVAIIGLSLIILSFIPVKYNVNLHLDNATRITLYQSGKASSDIYKTEKEEDFNNIIKTFNNTFSKDIFANAFFTGKLNNKENIEYNYQYNAISNIAQKSNSESKYILFSYSQEQQIVLNGKDYTSSELNSASKMFNQVLVEINDASTLTKSTIYYLNSSGNTNFRVTFYSTGEKLSNLIDEYFN